MESRLLRLIEPKIQLDSKRKVFSNASLMRMIVPLFFEQLLTMMVGIADAYNYDLTNSDAIGERVDKLYELKIGGLVLTLCDKCLNRLREKLTQRQLAAGEEHLKQLREKLRPRVSTEKKPEAYNG